MAKIESLKNYIGVLNEDEFIKLSKQIYDITDFICEDYPKHKEWYFHNFHKANQEKCCIY